MSANSGTHSVTDFDTDSTWSDISDTNSDTDSRTWSHTPKPEDTKKNLLPSDLVSPTQKPNTSTQYTLPYRKQLPRLQHNRSQQTFTLSDIQLPPPDSFVTFANPPPFRMPVAKLDPELELDMLAWLWRQHPGCVPGRPGYWYSVPQLLLLLTNFTRERGKNEEMDHVIFLSKIVCMNILLAYESPIKYDLSEMHLRSYGETRLAIHHSSGHFARLSSPTNAGGWTPYLRLTTWVPHEDHVTLYLEEVFGSGPTEHSMRWRDACLPDSSLIIFPPISTRDLTAHATRKVFL